MSPLYHYTCDHGHAALGCYRALIQPLAVWNPRAARQIGPERAMVTQLAWFTDFDTPFPRESLGLTQNAVPCDRTAHRYRVIDQHDVVPWLGSPWRQGPLVEALERVPGALPRHWWVAPVGVDVTYDPAHIWAAPA